jgi:hypothetical protein
MRFQPVTIALALAHWLSCADEVITRSASRENTAEDGGAAGDPQVPPLVPCGEGVAAVVDQSGSRCYMRFSAQLGWMEAQAACQQLSPPAQLAAVTGAEEAELVNYAAGVGAVWLGGSDAALESVFRWVTGEPLTFAAWAAGQPDQGGPPRPDCVLRGCEEDCIARDNDQAWHDRPCTDRLQYVCERALVP